MRYTILIQFIQMNSKVILKKCDYLYNHPVRLHMFEIFFYTTSERSYFRVAM